MGSLFKFYTRVSSQISYYKRHPNKAKCYLDQTKCHLKSKMSSRQCKNYLDNANVILTKQNVIPIKQNVIRQCKMSSRTSFGIFFHTGGFLIIPYSLHNQKPLIPSFPIRSSSSSSFHSSCGGLLRRPSNRSHKNQFSNLNAISRVRYTFTPFVSH